MRLQALEHARRHVLRVHVQHGLADREQLRQQHRVGAEELRAAVVHVQAARVAVLAEIDAHRADRRLLQGRLHHSRGALVVVGAELVAVVRRVHERVVRHQVADVLVGEARDVRDLVPDSAQRRRDNRQLTQQAQHAGAGALGVGAVPTGARANAASAVAGRRRRAPRATAHEHRGGRGKVLGCVVHIADGGARALRRTRAGAGDETGP
mmetsp:Transcript_16968/g.59399  ORF Transcript_16968/g.59399 Transcript_16968/m.59399 type:complete len:209 (+) Transcript_16968:1402-2028(+)